MWATFEDAILEDTGTFQNDMKRLHKEKKNMVTYCERTMRNEELKADSKAVVIMEELRAKKKYAHRELDDASA